MRSFVSTDFMQPLILIMVQYDPPKRSTMEQVAECGRSIDQAYIPNTGVWFQSRSYSACTEMTLRAGTVGTGMCLLLILDHSYLLLCSVAVVSAVVSS